MATRGSKGTYGKGNVSAARAFLEGIPAFTEHSRLGPYGINAEQAIRRANAFEKQLAAGVTPSNEAARGHVLTPEHPERRRPVLAEPAARYRSEQALAKSKYLTGERERAATAPAPARVHHQRQRGQGHIPYQDGGAIYTVNSARQAHGILHAEDGRDKPPRFVMQVFDCSAASSLNANAGWFPVLAHSWTSGGIDVADFLRMYQESGESWERFIMGLINGKDGKGDSDRSRRGPIQHICQYEITILPTAHRGQVARRAG